MPHSDIVQPASSSVCVASSCEQGREGHSLSGVTECRVHYQPTPPLRAQFVVNDKRSGVDPSTLSKGITSLVSTRLSTDATTRPPVQAPKVMLWTVELPSSSVPTPRGMWAPASTMTWSSRHGSSWQVRAPSNSRSAPFVAAMGGQFRTAMLSNTPRVELATPHMDKFVTGPQADAFVRSTDPVTLPATSMDTTDSKMPAPSEAVENCGYDVWDSDEEGVQTRVLRVDAAEHAVKPFFMQMLGAI